MVYLLNNLQYYNLDFLGKYKFSKKYLYNVLIFYHQTSIYFSIFILFPFDVFLLYILYYIDKILGFFFLISPIYKPYFKFNHYYTTRINFSYYFELFVLAFTIFNLLLFFKFVRFLWNYFLYFFILPLYFPCYNSISTFTLIHNLFCNVFVSYLTPYAIYVSNKT